MWLWQRLTRPRDGQPLPADIYISLVDALFKDFTSLIVPSITAVACPSCEHFARSALQLRTAM